MGRARSGGDAGADGVVQAEAAGRGQGVEVGGVGLLQLGPPVGTGEAGQAVEHHQHDLAGRGLDEGSDVESHGASLEKGRPQSGRERADTPQEEPMGLGSTGSSLRSHRVIPLPGRRPRRRRKRVIDWPGAEVLRV